MSGERLAQKAVTDIAAYLESNLSTYLTAVETERSLLAGTLTTPEDYTTAVIPDDPRSPVVAVYENAGSVSIRNGAASQEWVYRLVVEVGWGGDADCEASESFMRDYLTAVIRCLNAGTNAGSITALVQSYTPDATARGESIRYSYSVDVDVYVNEAS